MNPPSRRLEEALLKLQTTLADLDDVEVSELLVTAMRMHVGHTKGNWAKGAAVARLAYDLLEHETFRRLEAERQGAVS